MTAKDSTAEQDHSVLLTMTDVHKAFPGVKACHCLILYYHFDLLPDANCTREPICQREGLAG